MAGINDIKKVLYDFGKQFEEDLITSLKRNDHTPGGQSSLSGTFKYTVFGKEQSLFFEFYMADYGSYLDKGTKGATKRGTGGKKMLQSIKDWLERRELGGDHALSIYKSKLKNPNKSKVTFDKATTSLAYAIKKSIHKKGIRQKKGAYLGGTNWFTDVLNDGRINDLSDKLTEILGREVVVNLDI